MKVYCAYTFQSSIISLWLVAIRIPEPFLFYWQNSSTVQKRTLCCVNGDVTLNMLSSTAVVICL
jgi:hypothetical protein